MGSRSRMELCAGRALSNLPRRKPCTLTHSHPRWITSLPLKHTSISRTSSGLQYYYNSSLNSTTSEETSRGPSQNVKEDYGETEATEEDFPMDAQIQPFEFLNKFNLELDYQGSYSILLLGGGALAVLWLATAIVGAIDSIPVFPELMEVVGLAYTVWFSTRYLIFKKNRDELAAKLEEIKQQVIGSIDD